LICSGGNDAGFSLEFLQVGRDSQMLWNLRSGGISIDFSSNRRYSSEQSPEIKLTILKISTKKVGIALITFIDSGDERWSFSRLRTHCLENFLVRFENRSWKRRIHPCYPDCDTEFQADFSLPIDRSWSGNTGDSRGLSGRSE
jgi:hypothetical protein